MNTKLARMTATVFGVGKAKYMPGTLGSLAAVIFSLLYFFTVFYVNYLSNFKHHKITEFLLFQIDYISYYRHVFTYAIWMIILSIFGYYAAKQYLLTTEIKDPQEIVIDEFVGQMLTIFLTSMFTGILIYSNHDIILLNDIITKKYFVIYIILPFVAFRTYDIVKPWPINWLDKNIDGALGVMIDDIVAAILASISIYIIISFII